MRKGLLMPKNFTGAENKDPCEVLVLESLDHNFYYAVMRACLNLRNIDRQATFNRFMNILKQLLKGFTLCSASRDPWNFGPETTFLRCMHDDLDFHARDYTRNQSTEARHVVARALP
jgi:hypothetical protein